MFPEMDDCSSGGVGGGVGVEGCVLCVHGQPAMGSCIFAYISCHHL